MLTLAQQFIDSSDDGGGAFLVFAIMCFAIVGILFAVDKLRRGGTREDDES